MVCVKPHENGPARIMAQKPLRASVPTRPRVVTEPDGIVPSPNRFHSAW